MFKVFWTHDILVGRPWQLLSFSFPELWYSLLEFNSRKKITISAIKFETARLHFLRDVFVDVAVVVAYKAPLWNGDHVGVPNQ